MSKRAIANYITFGLIAVLTCYVFLSFMINGMEAMDTHSYGELALYVVCAGLTWMVYSHTYNGFALIRAQENLKKMINDNK